MRTSKAVLLDTHSFIWVGEGPRFPGYGLTRVAENAIIEADEAIVSHVSLWELAIKTTLPSSRALRLSGSYAGWVDAVVEQGGFTKLPISEAHLKRVATLPRHHGDPFDRLLVAQALVEGIPIVSADAALDAYGVERIW